MALGQVGEEPALAPTPPAPHEPDSREEKAEEARPEAPAVPAAEASPAPREQPRAAPQASPRQSEPAGKKTPPETDELADEELELPLIPAAPDDLGGHFRIGLGGGIAVPFGAFHADLDEGDRIAIGPALSFVASYGVSRVVAIGIGGGASLFGSSSACGGCAANSLALGPRIVYHLVQGTRFDPWAAAGVGYRITTLTGSSGGGSSAAAADQSYGGIEWLHLSVGGDWYPWPNLGLGPVMELDAGVYGERPAGTSRDSYWHFLLGIRVVLDVPGKSTPEPG